MTAQEKKEMKELFQDMLEVVNTKHNAEYEMINYKLDQITAQVLKTNGRVTKLEEKELVHISTCPLNDKVRVLEDNQLTNKSVKNWVVGSITITSIVVTVLMAALKLFIF